MKGTEKTPALRFRGFDDDWTGARVSDVTTYVDYRGKTPPKSASGIFLVTAKNVKVGYIDYECSKEYVPKGQYDEVMRRGRPRLGDVLITTEAPLGNVAAIDRIDVALAQRIIKFRGKEGVLSNDFLKHLLLSQSFQKLLNEKSTGSTAKGIKGSVLHKLPVVFPSIAEQQKIAAFLSAVDEKIRYLARKEKLLLKYKKGVMQRIFDRQIRFKDDNGNDYSDWEENKLNNYLFESKRRNTGLSYGKERVLSVSKDFGIVNQIQYLGRSYAGWSVHNYHVVKPGAIVYTKSPLKTNPYGIIKVNKGKAGIVSTLYAVYECKDNISGEFLDYFFQIDDNTNRYLRPLVRKGAKNDMKVNNAHVLTGLISVPSVPEQLVIVKFLSAIDQKISIVNQQLQKMRAFERGLLQQMFV